MTHPVIPALNCASRYAVAAELDAIPGRPLVSRRAGSACPPAVQPARPGHPAAWPNGSGRASRRSRNTIRVKPYATRFPSRNARHTALSAPDGCRPASGCSSRYRSSLRTWSGGPGGTSRTGQYRYPASGQHNGFPKSPATRHRRRAHECLPPSRTCWHAMTNPGTTFAPEAVARQHPGNTPDWPAIRPAPSCCSRRRLDIGQPNVRCQISRPTTVALPGRA